MDKVTEVFSAMYLGAGFLLEGVILCVAVIIAKRIVCKFITGRG